MSIGGSSNKGTTTSLTGGNTQYNKTYVGERGVYGPQEQLAGAFASILNQQQAMRNRLWGGREWASSIAAQNKATNPFINATSAAANQTGGTGQWIWDPTPNQAGQPKGWVWTGAGGGGASGGGGGGKTPIPSGSRPIEPPYNPLPGDGYDPNEPRSTTPGPGVAGASTGLALPGTTAYAKNQAPDFGTAGSTPAGGGATRPGREAPQPAPEGGAPAPGVTPPSGSPPAPGPGTRPTKEAPQPSPDEQPTKWNSPGISPSGPPDFGEAPVYGMEGGGLIGTAEELLKGKGFDPQTLNDLRVSQAMAARGASDAAISDINRAYGGSGSPTGYYGARAAIGVGQGTTGADAARATNLAHYGEKQRQITQGLGIEQDLYGQENTAAQNTMSQLAQLLSNPTGFVQKQQSTTSGTGSSSGAQGGINIGDIISLIGLIGML